ncbi:permease-like cell division protein FtsX [Fulvivirgaceae bacterium PWU5]|uniref:Cell division protein FtsX n=1 Tax=Dawidia cretensis TaxID=2782350 RepID=A0AAP2DXT6_9BACT|nr:permease-like cell division protein FtsX [Dawidia cretensis]MBT1709358.1 permease-like cell division protein FtsX [Dawidia cretensis]
MEKATRKKKLGGYPAVGVVFSITLALFALGLFGTLMIYSQEFGKMVRENLNVKVYLKSTLTENQRGQLEKILLGKEYVASGETALKYISKEEAEKDLVAQIGDYKEILGENPLKDAFIVGIKPGFQDTTNLKKIKADLETVNGILEATYEKHLFDAVNTNFFNISIVLIVIAVIMLVITFLLVSNTLRIALFSQRFLIRSMQLVGAKRWFIQRPFLFRAAGYGLLAGALTSALLWALSDYSQKKLPDIMLVHNQRHFLFLLALLLGIGMVVAVVSTFFSIHRYLKMSLDELY